MKKFLLFAGVLSGIGSFSQTFTVNDTLYTGLSTTYYVLDSNAVNHDAVTGSGVTWDYSTITGYPGLAPNPNYILDASSSPYATDFPTSDYNDDLSNGVSAFFTNSPDSMTVQGFVFSASGTDIVMKHSVNPLIAMKYPSTVGDTYADITAGVVDVGGQTGTTTGTVNVTVDGFGTLNVGTFTHTNITRVKLVENISTSVIVMGFPVSGTVTRTVYSYYDLTNTKQPVFIHATIDVVSTALNDNYTSVYYAGNLSSSIEENAVNAFSIYPNPANSLATLSTDGTADNLYVINALGQVVYALANPKSIETVDVSNFEKGIYIVQVTKGHAVANQKLIVE